MVEIIRGVNGDIQNISGDYLRKGSHRFIVSLKDIGTIERLKFGRSNTKEQLKFGLVKITCPNGVTLTFGGKTIEAGDDKWDTEFTNPKVEVKPEPKTVTKPAGSFTRTYKKVDYLPNRGGDESKLHGHGQR